MKAFALKESYSWAYGVDCGVIFAEDEKEALKIANDHYNSDSTITLNEIPIKKGYYYIGGYIE